jgi:hypothetical protein
MKGTIFVKFMHLLSASFAPAVSIQVLESSHTRIVQNHIHDLYRAEISVGWTCGYDPIQCHRNTIAFNHLNSIGKEMLSDMGRLYSGGVQPGTVIRGSLIRNFSSFSSQTVDDFVLAAAFIFQGMLNNDAPAESRAPGPKPDGLFSGSFMGCKVLKRLVGERGFEPPTPWSRIGCQVSHVLSGSEVRGPNAWGEMSWLHFCIGRISGEDEAG